MKLSKKLIKAIESTIPEIGITDKGDYFSVYVDNRCGEDFTIEINKGKDEVEELITSCDNYDAEEEFSVWYGANRGEPSNPGVLWNNCEEIGESLEHLKYFLENRLNK